MALESTRTLGRQMHNLQAKRHPVELTESTTFYDRAALCLFRMPARIRLLPVARHRFNVPLFRPLE